MSCPRKTQPTRVRPTCAAESAADQTVPSVVTPDGRGGIRRRMRHPRSVGRGPKPAEDLSLGSTPRNTAAESSARVRENWPGPAARRTQSGPRPTAIPTSCGGWRHTDAAEIRPHMPLSGRRPTMLSVRGHADVRAMAPGPGGWFLGRWNVLAPSQRLVSVGRQGPTGDGTQHGRIREAHLGWSGSG